MDRKVTFLAGVVFGGSLGWGAAFFAWRSERAVLNEVREAVVELRDRPAAAPEAAPRPAAVAMLDPTARRGEIAQVVREAVRAESAVAAATSAAAKAPPPPTPANLAAFDSGQRVVHRAFETRVWTEEARDELQALMGEMNAEGRASLLRKLIPALNRGDVHFEGAGSPL
jgi:hypothetical protein